MISEQQKPVDSGFGAKSEPAEVLKDIDLGGKVAMVTGGYSGIGLETTRALKEAGARVIVPARRKDVAKAALSGIVESEDILNLDLADPSSAQSFVNEFVDSGMSLDILINNAAVMACPQMPTKEGWDLQFAVNHIGHFIITKGLLPAMSSSGSRIVTLSSTGHKLSGIQWEDVHFEESYDKWKAYGQSKTAASLLAVEISKRMKISNDLRWMNSGPLAGLSEIELQALQPGSSIMPGKVNPVIPEAVTMVSADVIGNDVSITVAAQAGNFQLNVMLLSLIHI